MFDIGSPELLVIGIVALLVLGPERLPEAIRSFATWWGRLRRSIRRLTAQIEDEIGFDQIRHQLHEEQVIEEIGAIKIELNSIADDAGFSLGEVIKPKQISADPTHWPGMPPPESGPQ